MTSAVVVHSHSTAGREHRKGGTRKQPLPAERQGQARSRHAGRISAIFGADEHRRRAKAGEAYRYCVSVLPYIDVAECIIWPFSQTQNGYPLVSDGSAYRARAHRLICAITHGEPPSDRPECAHACGNKLCVNPRHLRWASRTENEHDKVYHGTKPLGEKVHRAKLSALQVIEIRRLHKVKAGTLSEIAAKFLVSKKAIEKIVYRENWRWVDG